MRPRHLTSLSALPQTFDVHGIRSGAHDRPHTGFHPILSCVSDRSTSVSCGVLTLSHSLFVVYLTNTIIFIQNDVRSSHFSARLVDI